MAAAGKKPHGRKKAPRVEGTWMSRSQIAARYGIDRGTLQKYLAQPGAPKPNGKNLYNAKTVVPWVRAIAPKLHAKTDEMRSINIAIARMRKEDMEIDLKAKRGELVEKRTIEPTIVTVMTLLTDNLTKEFVLALPSSYDGKTTAERAKMNEDAVARVLTQFKAGLAGIR